MTTLSTPPKRKSAQRASNLVRKFAVFAGGGGGSRGGDDDSDKESDGYHGEGGDVTSSSSEGEEGVESSAPPTTEEEGGSDGGTRSRPTRKYGYRPNYIYYPAYDTEKAYTDLISAPDNAMFSDLLAHLPSAELKEVHLDGRVEISVQNQVLGMNSAIDEEGTCIGYAGGTVNQVRWIPNSDIMCLAVSNSSHIVSYQNPSPDTLQFWSYESKHLTFLYSVKLTFVKDIIIYPYSNESHSTFSVCVACKTSVQLLHLPKSRPSTSPHYELVRPSLQLNLSPNPNNSTLSVTTVCWSVFNDRVHVLGGLNNGYILKWTIPSTVPDKNLLPNQKAAAHVEHPIIGISVCPQLQNYFASVSNDSRVKIWNLRNFNRPVFVQTRPQKQIMMPAYIRWCVFWNKILILSLTARRDVNVVSMCCNAALDPSRFIPSMHCPKIYPQELNNMRSRVMDFNDLNSSMVVGFQHGLAAVFHVAGIWDQRYIKFKHPLYSNCHYLECSVSVKTGLDTTKEFSDDQDYINHHHFTLSTALSDTFSKEAAAVSGDNEEFSRKPLTAVTCVEWSRVASNQNVCVCYMSGLFQIVTPPKPVLSTRKNKK